MFFTSVTEEKQVNNTDFLTARELQTFNAFKIEKRKREWLAGRLALKNAARLKFNVNYADIEIAPLESRQPVLFIKGKQSYPVSVSHSEGYACAVMATGVYSVGIDIEKIRDYEPAFKTDWFLPEEGNITNEDYTLSWTRKEAVLKAMGIGLNVDLRDITFKNNRPVFAKTALKAWQKLGRKNIMLDRCDAPNGFIISLAYIKETEAKQNGQSAQKGSQR